LIFPLPHFSFFSVPTFARPHTIYADMLGSSHYSSPVAAVHHHPLKPKLESQWQATCPVACEVLKKACIANLQSEQIWLAAIKLKVES
jgi:hypothetical protein